MFVGILVVVVLIIAYVSLAGIKEGADNASVPTQPIRVNNGFRKMDRQRISFDKERYLKLQLSERGNNKPISIRRNNGSIQYGEPNNSICLLKKDSTNNFTLSEKEFNAITAINSNQYRIVINTNLNNIVKKYNVDLNTCIVSKHSMQLS